MSLPDLLSRELAALEERGLRRQLRSLTSPQGAVITLDGQQVVNFSANNYLGLAASPEIRAGARAALDQDGAGAGASRLIVGNLRSHRELEQALASFHQTAAALLFTSGYQANLGVLTALAGPEDAIFSDALNHASIIDGCRLSKARTVVYAHRDTRNLEEKLIANPARRRFIVTDTVFSMDGDLAPLVELRRLADRHQAFLIIDEAHATGALGPQGTGLAALLGIVPDVHVATLSKAVGCFGAYVAGAQPLIDYLLNRARSFVFTTALPPPVTGAALAALAIIRSDAGDALRASLRERINQFADAMSERRLLAPGAGGSPIFPLMIGDERRALAATERLLELGIYAQAIRPPTVPKGTSRLRFALMATHEPAHVEQAIHAIDALLREGILRT